MACSKPISGFSLFECVLVVALIAILIALTSVHTGFIRQILVRAEIEKLHTICGYLKCVAMVSNTPQTLTFDPEKSSYTYENTHETLPQQLRFGAATGILGPPSAPQKPITHGITFPRNQIIFYPTGIVHAGTVYLSDKEGTYTGALSCAVSHASYVRKYAYTGRWKLLT